MDPIRLLWLLFELNTNYLRNISVGIAENCHNFLCIREFEMRTESAPELIFLLIKMHSLYRKSNLYIPGKGIVRLSPNSYVPVSVND